jgi:hypothetical protein
MGRIWLAVAVCALVLSNVAGRSASGAQAASHVAAPTAKKVCKKVVKKVHGKKKRVKVCHKVAVPAPTPTATAISTPTPSSDRQAEQLAAAVTSAGDDAARHQALLDVMRALHIGVDSPDTGQPIVSGYETNAKDFYLYDGELSTLAYGLGHKQFHTMADLAAVLIAAGIKPQGQAVNATSLQALVQALVAFSTAHPDQPASLLPVLVRDLGTKHSAPYDLAQSSIVASPQLDDLQFTLLAVDLLYPIIHTLSQAHTALSTHLMAHNAACTALKFTISSFNPNSYLGSNRQLTILLNTYAGNEIGALVSQLLSDTKAASAIEGAGLANTIFSAIHGIVLATGLQMDSTSQRQSTHYGPIGHYVDAGKNMLFTVTLTMQVNVGATAIACLSDAGISVPGPGPVPDVEISWNSTDAELSKYGTVETVPADSRTGDGTNGAKGVSELLFTPNDEKIPDIGQVVTVTGGEEPRALWASALGNSLAVFNQVFTPLLGPEIGWQVTYHKPRGFKFVVEVQGHDGSGEVDNITYTGQICGDTPDGTWNIAVNGSHHDPHSDTGDLQLKTTAAWVLRPDGVFTQSYGTLYHPNGFTLIVVPNDPQPPKIVVNYLFKTTTFQAIDSDPTVVVPPTDLTVLGNASGTATLVENTDCPDNSA